MTATAVPRAGSVAKHWGAVVAFALAIGVTVALVGDVGTFSEVEPDVVAVNVTAVFPHDGRAFDDPVEAASAFAAEMLGIANPVAPSEVRGVVTVAVAGGSLPIDVVRDGDWWFVVGAAGVDISLTRPDTEGQILGSPFEVAGEWGGPAARLSIALFADGDAEPIAEATAWVGARRPTPFTAELTFDTPRAYWGVLVVRALDGAGRTTDAAAVRVGF